jgi:hypothetical protein
MGGGKTVSEWEALTAKWKGSHGNGNGHGPSLAIEVRKLLSDDVAPDARRQGPQGQVARKS